MAALRTSVAAVAACCILQGVLGQAGNTPSPSPSAFGPYVLTVLGNGTCSASMGSACAPQAIALAATGMFFSSAANHTVRQLRVSDQSVVNIAGTFNRPGFAGDGGLANVSQINTPYGLAFDANSVTLYIADTTNNRVRAVLSNGTITTFAGNGVTTSLRAIDGVAATNSSLMGPIALAYDPTSASLFIAELAGNRIRRVARGIISTIAGSVAGTSGYSGDGGAATSALFSSPALMVLFAVGSGSTSSMTMYVSDVGNGVIRNITLSSIAGSTVGTYAGSSKARLSAGDGYPALNATFVQPLGLAVDSRGGLFIADVGASVIRYVNASSGIINTQVGTGVGSYNGEFTPPLSTQLNGPVGIAFEPGSSTLFIADSSNNRIRRALGMPVASGPASSATPSATRTNSMSMTATSTMTPSRGASSPSSTVSVNASRVANATVTAPSASSNVSASMSASMNASASYTPTATFSRGANASASASAFNGTASATASIVYASASSTSNASVSRGANASMSMTSTASTAATVNSSATATFSRGASASMSASRSPSASTTRTAGVSANGTTTASVTSSPTSSTSYTSTATGTASSGFSNSNTPSPTSTGSNGFSSSASPSVTSSVSSSVSASGTGSSSPSASVTGSVSTTSSFVPSTSSTASTSMSPSVPAPSPSSTGSPSFMPPSASASAAASIVTNSSASASAVAASAAASSSMSASMAAASATPSQSSIASTGAFMVVRVDIAVTAGTSSAVASVAQAMQNASSSTVMLIRRAFATQYNVTLSNVVLIAVINQQTGSVTRVARTSSMRRLQSSTEAACSAPDTSNIPVTVPAVASAVGVVIGVYFSPGGCSGVGTIVSPSTSAQNAVSALQSNSNAPWMSNLAQSVPSSVSADTGGVAATGSITPSSASVQGPSTSGAPSSTPSNAGTVAGVVIAILAVAIAAAVFFIARARRARRRALHTKHAAVTSITTPNPLQALELANRGGGGGNVTVLSMASPGANPLSASITARSMDDRTHFSPHAPAKHGPDAMYRSNSMRMGVSV